MAGDIAVHTVSVDLYVPATATWYPLSVDSLTLTTDASWQPYVQAEIVCAAVGAVTQADPRLAQRVRITLRETPGATTVTALNLSLRTARLDYETSTYRLSASSAEADVQDRNYLSSPAQLGPAVWAGIREGMEDLLQTYLLISPSVIDFTNLPLGTSAALASGMVLQPGDPWWPPLADLPQRIGWQVWCGLDGIWRTAEAVPTPTASVATVSIGKDIEAYQVDTTRDGDQWADSVCVVYTWTNTAGGSPARIVGAASVVGTQTKVIRRDSTFQVTQAQADARASQLVQLVRRRGATYQVTVPARYDIRARTFIDVVNLAGVVTQVYVSAVRWNLPDATLLITARSA